VVTERDGQYRPRKKKLTFELEWGKEGALVATRVGRKTRRKGGLVYARKEVDLSSSQGRGTIVSGEAIKEKGGECGTQIFPKRGRTPERRKAALNLQRTVCIWGIPLNKKPLEKNRSRQKTKG